MSARKPITIRGVLYPSNKAAATALGVTRSAIYYAAKDGKIDRVGVPRAEEFTRGVGINDLRLNKPDPYYSRWFNMLTRCYTEFCGSTYDGCTVDPVWHPISAFKGWMEQQDWQGKELDKDILVPGNTVYRPDRCCFVSKQVNDMVGAQINNRDLPTGVYRAQYGPNYIGKVVHKGVQIHLGTFATPDEAYDAYCTAKAAIIRDLAAQETDPRIIAGLHQHADLYEQGTPASLILT